MIIHAGCSMKKVYDMAKKEFPTKRDVMSKKGWKEIPEGAVITSPGSSILNKTGSWKSFRPRWNKDKCTHCLLCAVFCPDNCIHVNDGKRKDTDLDFCKGCGICAEICPVKAIKMVEDKETS